MSFPEIPNPLDWEDVDVDLPAVPRDVTPDVLPNWVERPLDWGARVIGGSAAAVTAPVLVPGAAAYYGGRALGLWGGGGGGGGDGHVPVPGEDPAGLAEDTFTEEQPAPPPPAMGQPLGFIRWTQMANDFDPNQGVRTRRGSEDLAPGEMGPPAPLRAPKRYQEVVADFWALDRRAMRRLQERMWDGGFFDFGSFEPYLNPEEGRAAVRWGTPDELSQAAFQAVAEMAILQDMTIDEVLAQGKLDHEAQLRRLARGEQARREAEEFDRKVTFILDDPAALAELADTVGQDVLGRDASEEERRYAVALVHHLQAQNQKLEAEHAGTAYQVDAEAQVRQALETANPAEAGANRVNEQWQVLRQLLGGRAG